jgi:hypothetical protein
MQCVVSLEFEVQQPAHVALVGPAPLVVVGHRPEIRAPEHRRHMTKNCPKECPRCVCVTPGVVVVEFLNQPSGSEKACAEISRSSAIICRRQRSETALSTSWRRLHQEGHSNLGWRCRAAAGRRRMAGRNRLSRRGARNWPRSERYTAALQRTAEGFRESYIFLAVAAAGVERPGRSVRRA